MTLGRILRLLLALVVAIAVPASAEDNVKRTRYMGTAVFSMPTGYTRSATNYINDNSHSAFMLSQAMFGDLVELSMLRHLSGDFKGKNPMSVKIKLLEEGGALPSIVYGASDLTKAIGSKIFYFAASKSIEAFGAHLHGGIYKDPITSDRKTFYGVEKMVLPLITLSAERSDEVNTFGVKLSPYPGVSLEVGQRDAKEEIYNINYFRSF
ncbi:MAG: hypothetical protein CVV41_13310 [Candidatus Riflebacteria bacterium HGW-Riflebacteria-1]|jgi:hypothetical protein|nr:MAG: hypothetical protein CVV41_13310 [Candidatus Riflebacteria bacterium HGW-Riflebacteria-1]